MARSASLRGGTAIAVAGAAVVVVIVAVTAPAGLAVLVAVVLLAGESLRLLRRGHRMPGTVAELTEPRAPGLALRGGLVTAAAAHLARGLGSAAGGLLAVLAVTLVVLPGLVRTRAETTTVVAALPPADGQQDRFDLFDAVSRPGRRARAVVTRALARVELVAALVVSAAAVGLDRHAATLVLLALLGVAALGALLEAGVLARSQARRSAARFETNVVSSLAAYAPQFLAYFSASEAASTYQLRQWLPYLRASGRRFAIITREPELVTPLARLAPGVPVVGVVRLVRLDPLVVPSVRAVVYVNNGMRNAQMLRHTRLRHIQLQHGESDKSPSVNKFFRAYDEIYVAGQAAIDRYAAHGLSLDPRAVRVVGRPQADAISTAVPPGRPAVLYAPTWEGFEGGGRYEPSVATLGVRLVRHLLDRGDVRVIVRPHPATGRVTPALRRSVEQMRELVLAARGDHVWSTLDGELSLVDCFDLSTVLISDVSSVVADYLRSEKALVVTDVEGVGPEAFRAAVPTAAAAWILAPDAGNLDEILADALGPDTLREQRRLLRRYVLGDFDGPAEPVFQATFAASVEAGRPRPTSPSETRQSLS